MAVLLALAMVAAACAPAVPPAPEEAQQAVDCVGDLGDPESGTPAWDQADLNNQQCANEGRRITEENPAVTAATMANWAEGQWLWQGDPFRTPHRWADRGTYELTSYQDRNGQTWSAALFGPPDDVEGPHPGVLFACHVCPFLPTTEGVSGWYWAAQALAEAGYVVMYATIAVNSVPTTVDAADFFTATPEEPTAQGEFNPWHDRLDRSRLGITGHSGGALVALEVGHTDPRFDAVVAWDPAPIGGVEELPLRIPTMVQVADYDLFAAPTENPEKPTPEPGSKYTFVDTISDAGIDAMQVAPRASTHLDWIRFPTWVGPHTVYNEMVALYYTLAWFDRYLVPSRADDALQRLTASGTDTFDGSADVHSIGAGFYDEDKAQQTGDIEAGNVPFTIEGLPIRNLLSFLYDSKYLLEDGTLTCEDMRAGCPQP